MRKIKKALALSLALAMGLSLVACGDDTESTTTSAPASSEEASSEDASSEDASSEEASSEETGAAAMEAPSTDGWDESKKIYAYSWDEDFSKKLNLLHIQSTRIMLNL